MKISYFLFLLSTLSFAARPFRGSYEVPVNETNDPTGVIKNMDNRFYDIKFKSNVDDVINATSFDIQLPAELVGETQVLTLNRGEGTEWSGDKILQANCIEENIQLPGDDEIENYFSCFLKMKEIPVDELKVEALMNSTQTDPALVSDKLAVTKIFSNELIGVLRYKMRGRGRDDHGDFSGRRGGRGGRRNP